MKKKLLIALVPLTVIIIAVSCNGGKGEVKQVSEPVQVASEPEIDVETTLLLKELVVGGDYVNSQDYPSLIKSSLVNDPAGSKQLILDIRTPDKFKSGHIKGAKNVSFNNLPRYFESDIKPFEYERIVLVCDDGQFSSYATALLRLKGYGNVYAMRWGMSAWNESFAQMGWLGNLSGEFESKLDTTTSVRPPASAMPVLKTGFTTGSEIADARFASLFSEEPSVSQISSAEVFADPSAFYIINLERKDKYDSGHIPGAIRYKPDGTLGFSSEMASIPYDKPVVVYCGTGHNSAFATGYLRLFG